MKTQLPAQVTEYLDEILFEQRELCCAIFDNDGKVVQSLGPLANYGITEGSAEVADMVAGFAPTESTLVPFVQYGNGRAAHLHHIYRNGLRFVVLFAADYNLADIGAQQQLTNEMALVNERQAQTIQALTQAQQLLRDSEKELKRAHDLKSLFISKMSHEFGTPITAVLGRLKLLEAEIGGAEGNVHLSVIRRGVQHLHQLVQSVLDEARLEQGTLRLEPAKVRLSILLDDLVQLFVPAAQEKGLVLQHALVEDHVLWIDGLRVKQVLINLISNAIKYTPAGRVAVYLNWRDNKLTASVTDTGPGMTREQADSLFKPFRRLDERVAISGTGLGLAISRELAQHMGGSIEVRSLLGEGSSFIFTMPCETVAERQLELIRGTRVLIIDDDADIRDLLTAVLRGEGYQVATASNASEAEREFKSCAPDVILLDMQLGVESGPAVARRLRKLGAAARIVALSASNSYETSSEALASGCDTFLSKPVDFDRLKELMQEDGWIR